jgi:hypothetical protein
MQTQNENQDERAIHEGFMREALKMVRRCHFLPLHTKLSALYQHSP